MLIICACIFTFSPHTTYAAYTATDIYDDCPDGKSDLLWMTCVTVKVETAAIEKGVTSFTLSHTNMFDNEGIWHAILARKESDYWYYTSYINRANSNDFELKVYQNQNTLSASSKLIYTDSVDISGRTKTFTITGAMVGAIPPVLAPSATVGNAKAQLVTKGKCNGTVGAISSGDDTDYTIKLKNTSNGKEYTFDKTSAPVDTNGFLVFSKIAPGNYFITSTVTKNAAAYDCDPSGGLYKIFFAVNYRIPLIPPVKASETVDWGMIQNAWTGATKLTQSTPSSTSVNAGTSVSSGTSVSFRLFPDLKCTTDTLTCWIGAVFGWSQTAILLLATVVIVFAGLIYMTSAGNEKQIALSKRLILGALSGVTVIVLGRFFLTVVIGVPWL